MYNPELFSRLSEKKVPVSTIQTSWLAEADVTLNMHRLDQLHPKISGNKWFKLRNHLQHAFDDGYSSILSFGGAWSNHIHALAAAGKNIDFPTVGVIRGERAEVLSSTLQDAESWGMRLHFISRADYRVKHNPEFLQQLLDDLRLSGSDVWIVPEGGSGELGVKGCEYILSAGRVSPETYDQIWLASGTGTTAAGVIRSAPETCVQSVAVLKGASWMKDEIQQYLSEEHKNWSVDTESHCGGYARTTPELLKFIEQFEQETEIPLEPVYTGKMMFSLYKKCVQGKIARGCRLLAIHTGGLQGRRGF
ncbi:hypothetical protein [Parendozoicomonas sp. Alg238-R29]|uniref:1-aminocyclopropane-1-carboxylate deaminase/D-cysteine desulfhydrase n=1 Tax=Parendozoicomonas sp. Alg238-R29 TaxID=2993446 RepID=UPI00248DC24D|nr:hypothetical protein [Parendozoicomonas sp. Alg238-R29]